jgi:hypothetical protein
MDAGFLRFDPASEFEVIESIDFEEEVARPESLRFYTLNEQLLDYFDKVLPKKAKITKFEYKAISNEVDRLRDIYQEIITITDTDYKVDFSRKEVHVDWVKPIYTGVSLETYSYATNWIPLYKPESRTTPNYYPRMLAALPKPYKVKGTDGVSYKDGGILVDEEGKNSIHTLPTYERTKGVIHEDGSFSVVKIPITNTSDDIKVKGFFIEKRPFEIPNPLSDHPFLASNSPSKFLTEEPLNLVFPTIEAIMTHGIPKTTDPYNEGKQFLKIYDVKLNQVTWDLWKETFKPVDTISTTPTILSVAFPPREDETAPSKNLQEIYLQQWYPGIEPRFWLASQEDNGVLVSKMILSKASKSGLTTPAIVSERPVSAMTKSSPEECFIVENFQEFLNSGVYRSPLWEDVNKAIDKSKPIPVGHCIPLAQIVQERADALIGNKVAWTETTEADLIRDHQKLLKYFQHIEMKPKIPVYNKYAGQPQTDLRRQVLALLNDRERMPSDKADAVEKILRGIVLKDDQYFENDSFLVCGHTLSELKGDLENDKNSFYDRWTVINEGFQVCKYCGQQINRDVFAAQDDFDEDGNVIISREVLTTAGDGHADVFTNSLLKLKSAFILDNPGETIMYLLISLLQVLPTETQLLPIIQNIRELTSLLRANKKIEKEAKERTEGVLGIAGMVILLQTHNPFLIPRRSFGSKLLKLTGYPRDTEEQNDSPTLDILITVLKTTFESSPNTFKGPSATLLRKIITEPKSIRKESLMILKQNAQKFKTQLVSAKERYSVPTEATITGQLYLPVLKIDKTTYKPDERNGEEETSSACDIPMPRTYLTGRLPPSVSQDPIVLDKTNISEFATFITDSHESREAISLTDGEIRKKIGVGFPKGIKLEKIETFLKSDTDGIAILSLLNRILDVVSRSSFSPEKIQEYRNLNVYLRTTINPSLLRDASRGIIYELLHDIKGKPAILTALNTALQRDLVFSMILLTKEQATTQDSDLRTREREVFKQRMRAMNDTEREATKMLLDIGIASYIITNEDREIFAKEYRIVDPEAAYDAEANAEDLDRPEEGYNASRDVEDGVAAIVEGYEQQVDYGDYGDRREEKANRDYDTIASFDFDEGYGV